MEKKSALNVQRVNIHHTKELLLISDSESMDPTEKIRTTVVHKENTNIE